MLTESYKKAVRSENSRKMFLGDVYFGGGETKSCVFKIQPITNNLPGYLSVADIQPRRFELGTMPFSLYSRRRILSGGCNRQ